MERRSLLALLALPALSAWSADILQSAGAMPAHLAGTFTVPLAYQTLPDGTAYVFDRRVHTVYRVDAARTTATALVKIGGEAGRLLQPSAFDSVADGRFVVADAPLTRSASRSFIVRATASAASS